MDTLRIGISVGFAPVGFGAGVMYFALMRYSLNHLSRKKTGIVQFVGLAVLRVVLFGGGLLGALLVGTWSLIAYVLGFVAARAVAVSRARTAADFSPPAAESGKDHV